MTPRLGDDDHRGMPPSSSGDEDRRSRLTSSGDDDARSRPSASGDDRRLRPALSDGDYRRLLDLRTGLRRFLRWSERQAQAAGLTPAQHQLLLAIRGHPDPRGPTIGDAAAYLLLRHHSVVGLVDRAEAAGLVSRGQDPSNISAVRLRLTEAGARQLETLSELHVEELAHLAPTMQALWEALEEAGGAPHPAARPGRNRVRHGRSE